MKRFQWRLQRLLDITEQREQVARAELFRIAQQILAVCQEIVERQTVVRMILADLAARDLIERLDDQTVVLTCSAAEQRVIERLRGQQSELEAERETRMSEFLRIRSTRRTLERLREEARQEHLRDEARREQKQFDETAHMAFARKERPRLTGAVA